MHWNIIIEFSIECNSFKEDVIPRENTEFGFLGLRDKDPDEMTQKSY